VSENLPAVVDYLVLEPRPHLVASECAGCHTRYLKARAACPGCGHRTFTSVDLPGTGTVRTFSVIARAPYDAVVPAPYAAGVVALTDGTTVSASIIGVDPAEVTVGLEVELVPVPREKDIAFGFRPVAAA
jgi:uncharacterized OB-fold protein